MTAGSMLRRAVAAMLVLSAWVAGSVLGSIGGAPPAAGGPFLQVGRAHAEFEPVLDGKEPIFILVLGSDSRPGTPVDRGLADSIHILGINPAKGKATLLGFPRDSYVPLSTGGTNKINAAMPQGGPQAMIDTVENLTGIQMDYYALTGFGGLTRAVDQIGGLTVDLPTQLVGYDKTFPAGTQRLNGRDALQVARTRKSLANGDFGRSENQGLLMISALTQFPNVGQDQLLVAGGRIKLRLVKELRDFAHPLGKEQATGLLQGRIESLRPLRFRFLQRNR